MKGHIKKNQIVITAFAIMIAVAGYINYSGNLRDLLNNKNETKVEQESQEEKEVVVNDVEPDVTLPDSSLIEPGTAILTGSGNVNISGIISEAKINREQIRARNKESLIEIVNNQTLSESSKQDAIKQMSKIADYSEKEIAAELLLEAKGFSNIVVSITDTGVDVVVGVTELTDVQRAQIEDVVKRKTQVNADKITINICNN